ncbi:MAG: YrdB family protein [Saccharothrix sp.]|nr:YrdB family protein [Saccharothrix sp.]
MVLTARFLTELALLVALGVTGAHLGGGVVLGTAFAVLLPVAAAVLWGLFIGPKARRRLPEPARFGVEVVLFATAGLGLGVASDLPATGIAVAVAGIGFAALTRVVAKDW